MPPKGDPRAASERLENGIDRYGDGDLVGAAVEFEEALRLSPDHTRARQYLSWVKDVLAGSRGHGKKKDLDEDAVRAVTEALDSDDGLSRPDESPWDPVPLTPSNAQRELPAGAGIPTIPYGLEAAVAPLNEAPPEPTPASVPVEPVARAPLGTARTELAMRKLDDSLITGEVPAQPPAALDHAAAELPPSTILGIAPPREGLLTPVSPSSGARLPRPVEEDRPDSVTREWGRGPPTLHNLVPLDVPELTEEQVAELISLESSLPTTGPGGSMLTAELASAPDLPTERKSFVEFEAEATPLPHRSPVKLQPVPFASDFDPLELIPTQARHSAAPDQGVLNPLPVDERPDLRPDDDEGGTHPTNPFIRSKLATYAYGQAPHDDELPPSPSAIDAIVSMADRFAVAKQHLAAGDAASALDAADGVVTSAGGVDADPCLPYLSLLEKIYAAAIGPFDRVPQHGGSVPDLDPRAAFLLSRLDGSMSVDDLLDVSGMSRLEAMRVLALLIRHHAVVTK